jgi:PilZ domain-containing protein
MTTPLPEADPMDIRGESTPIERRRHPRSAPHEASELLWPGVVDIEIMDLSLTGVAFSASAELPVGRRVQVRTVLGGAPFSAAAEVIRTELGTQTRRTNRYLVACIFPNLDDANRKTLGRFLGNER